MPSCHPCLTAIYAALPGVSAFVAVNAQAQAINPHCLYQPIDINQYGHQDFQNPATTGIARRHH